MLDLKQNFDFIYIIKYKMENFVYDIDSLRSLNLNIRLPLPIFAYLVDEAFKLSVNQYNSFSVGMFE